MEHQKKLYHYYLWSKEMISFENSLKPLNKIYYDNILDAINDY